MGQAIRTFLHWISIQYFYYLYIHFYNHARFQTKLNSLSPYEYRTQAA
ncbi:IS3 family transposase [Paenibacillus sp. NPDC058367]